MLYVIPLVLLLAVFVFLKIRSDKNKSGDKGKKTAAKKTATKTSKKSDSSQSQQVNPDTSPDELSEQNATTTIDEKFRANIEQLIKTRSFHSAEAKINQALNQDHTQHELYLYLVDIHLAQSDEFAIKQLLNYIRSLGLHDIATQAEEKQRTYVPQEVIEPKSSQSLIPEQEQPSTPKQNTNKAFDALIIDNHVDTFDSSVNESKPTDDLQVLNFYDDHKPDPVKPVQDVVESNQVTQEPQSTADPAPLEFEFKIAKDSTEEPARSTNAATTENIFDLFDLSDVQTPAESKNTAPAETEQAESVLQDLSFDDHLDQVKTETTAQSTQVKQPEFEIHIEEFQFDEQLKTATQKTTQPDDLSESRSVEVASSKIHSDDQALEFNLDIPDFQLNPQVQNEATDSATISLEPESLKLIEETSVAPQADLPDLAFESHTLEFSSTPSAPLIDEEFNTTVDVPSINPSPVESAAIDPLAQAFPQVSEVDEVELDLQLAARYIELGAYESAKILLARNATKYTDEQREVSEKLLNQMAS